MLAACTGSLQVGTEILEFLGTGPYPRNQLVVWLDMRVGWSVDPFPADGLIEHVHGSPVLGGDDVGVVLVSASGHWGVDACVVGGAVDEE